VRERHRIDFKFVHCRFHPRPYFSFVIRIVVRVIVRVIIRVRFMVRVIFRVIVRVMVRVMVRVIIVPKNCERIINITLIVITI
jgi:hypothetical protein